MVDASDHPFEENIEHTREAVEAVRDGPEEMLVEGELGRVAGKESGVETSPDEAFYTDPDDAVQFVEQTGVDLLAVSVGTQHGVASGRELDVRPDVADEVNTALHEAGHDVPLVVHGSSGVTDEQVTEFLEAGVCKFNKNTRYQYGSLEPPPTSIVTTRMPSGRRRRRSRIATRFSRTASGRRTRRTSTRTWSPTRSATDWPR